MIPTNTAQTSISLPLHSSLYNTTGSYIKDGAIASQKKSNFGRALVGVAKEGATKFFYAKFSFSWYVKLVCPAGPMMEETPFDGRRTLMEDIL